MPQSSLETLLKTKQTIFAIRELAYLWHINNPDTLKSKIFFLVKNKKLIRLQRGVYALDNQFDEFELAGKLKSPSYISLETILAREGVVFQYSSDITSISNISKTIRCKEIDYVYRKTKDRILFNKMGIIDSGAYFRANKERAVLDTIYLCKDYYFDNLRSLNWKKCFSLVKIYQTKAMEKRLKQYQKIYADQ